MTAPLVPVPIRCVYHDPDGDLSSRGRVTAKVLGRSRVPSAGAVIVGGAGWSLVDGALPSDAQLAAPPSGTIYYQITELIEGYVTTYTLPVTAASAIAGIDLSTAQVTEVSTVALQVIPGAQGPPGDVSTAQLAAAMNQTKALALVYSLAFGE